MIKDRLTYGRNTPWQASKRERKRGRDLTWTLRGMPAPPWVMENWPGSATILAVRCKGIREGKPVDEIRYYVSSLRTGAEALLQHVRDRWSIENSWHWPRDTQLREDAHRYRESNGVRIIATLRSLAMNALRLDGFWSALGWAACSLISRWLSTQRRRLPREQRRMLQPSSKGCFLVLIKPCSFGPISSRHPRNAEPGACRLPSIHSCPRLSPPQPSDAR